MGEELVEGAGMPGRIAEQERAAIPLPAAPVLPVLSWLAFARGGAPAPAALSDAPALARVASGTQAIALALHHCAVGPGDQVLLPAYHCPSMIEPVLALGAEPVYYCLGPDLRIDLPDVERRAGPRTRALLLTHYFGFPQPLGPARALCDRLGLALLEDCAHAYYGDFDGRRPGAEADYAIGSAGKFFAVGDGGWLASGRHRLRGPDHGAGLAAEARTLLSLFEGAARYRRLRPLDWPLGMLLRLLRRLRPAPQQPSGQAPAQAFDAGDPAAAARGPLAPRPMTRVSRAMVRAAGAGRIARRRRDNYRRIVAGVASSDEISPLFDRIPEGVVPYMVPLLVRNEAVYVALKLAGVPAWRWEDGFPDDCPVSRRYAVELLQIPCHQDLREREIRWIVQSLRAAASGTPIGRC